MIDKLDEIGALKEDCGETRRIGAALGVIQPFSKSNAGLP
jgi:hypothetical protein